MSQRLWTGRYSPARQREWPLLTWSSDSCEPPTLTESTGSRVEAWPVSELDRPALTGLAWSTPDVVPTWLLDAAGPPNTEAFAGLAAPPCPRWRQPRAVTLGRFGGEWDTLQLLDCTGAVSADALDRLSVLARPPHTERPTLPLPLEPDGESAQTGEWLPRIRMVHPRLVWLVQRIASAFPARSVYIVSGYRPEAPASLHYLGRALDLVVQGTTKEAVFSLCRTLPDVGCGYYPNSRFVHVDVRPPGSRHVFWIDTAGPGEPARYVDSWDGGVAQGALEDAGENAGEDAGAPPAG